MKCPASDPGFAEHPIHGYEAQLPLIRQVVKLCSSPRRQALDVGAHIGVWSLELSRHFEEVHAFEPVEENYLCLLDNVARRSVTVHPWVVGSLDGFRTTLSRPVSSNSGMWQSGLPSDDMLTVTSVIRSIDSFWFKDVGLIKIDTEGYEGQVIKGAKRTIEESRPVIVFEDNGLGPKTYGGEWVEPKPLLLRLGYNRAFRIRKDEIWVPSP
jgi:FkbM family methyltransferase